MKALVFAGILSIAAASAVQAGGHSTSGDFHANAVPACDTEKCPMLAGDTGPGGPGDDNGRSQASNMAGEWHPVLAGGKPIGSDFHANAAPACDTEKCPLLAEDGPPGTAGDKNGRSQASNTADGRPLILAASRPNSGGNINI